jgi:NAD(P) transhydrogenase
VANSAPLTPQFLVSIGEKGHYGINYEDEVVRGAIVTRDREILWPAPRPTTPPAATIAPPKPVSVAVACGVCRETTH